MRAPSLRGLSWMTGIRSCFARRMGARRDFVDKLVCVAAYFELSDRDCFSRLTMLEAVEDGWWYAAKLPKGQLAVVVASDPQIVKEIGLHRSDRWLECFGGHELSWAC